MERVNTRSRKYGHKKTADPKIRYFYPIRGSRFEPAP